MNGWNLNNVELKAEFDRLHPDWNKQRKCMYCGETFWSGKPHSVCLGCAKEHGMLVTESSVPRKGKRWMDRLSVRTIRLMAIPPILCSGYMTDAVPLTIGISLFVALLAFTQKGESR